MRVTEKMLEDKVNALNQVSKCRYRLGTSYDAYNLEQCSMETTGISTVSFGNTTQELYYQLCVTIEVMKHEKENKTDYVKNCLHMDTFNHFEGKRNVSHIYEKDGKFKCMTCKNNVSKKIYADSIKLRTIQEVRALKE